LTFTKGIKTEDVLERRVNRSIGRIHYGEIIPSEIHNSQV
jgi:hypothetical protein